MRTVTVDGLEVVLCDAIGDTDVGVSVTRGPWYYPDPAYTVYSVRQVTVSLVPGSGSCLCGFRPLQFRLSTPAEPSNIVRLNTYSGGQPAYTSYTFPDSYMAQSADGLALTYNDCRYDWSEYAGFEEYGLETRTVTRVTMCADDRYYRKARVVLTCQPANGGTATGGGYFTCQDSASSFSITATENVGFRFDRIRKRVSTGDPSVDGPFTSVPVSIPVDPLLDCVSEYDENQQEYVIEFLPVYTNRILVADDGKILVTDHRESPILLHA